MSTRQKKPETRLCILEKANLAAQIAEKLLEDADGDEEGVFMVISIAVSLLFNSRFRLTDQA